MSRIGKTHMRTQSAATDDCFWFPAHVLCIPVFPQFLLLQSFGTEEIPKVLLVEWAPEGAKAGSWKPQIGSICETNFEAEMQSCQCIFHQQLPCEAPPTCSSHDESVSWSLQMKKAFLEMCEQLSAGITQLLCPSCRVLATLVPVC